MKTAIVVCLGLAALACPVACNHGSPPSGDGASRDGSTPPVTGTDEIWFEDLGSPITFSSPEVERTLRSLRRALLAGDRRLPDAPLRVINDQLPRIVFLSVSEGDAPATVALGAGRGLQAALGRALVQLEERPEQPDVLWIKLDVVNRVDTAVNVTEGSRLELPRSLHGVAFSRQIGLAFLPEELVAYTVVNSDGKLRLSNVEKCLRSRPGRAAALPSFGSDGLLPLRHFATDSYFFDGDEVFRLYRGHRDRRQRHAPSNAQLISAAHAGGEYLRRAVRPDGSFVYSYLPKTDEAKDSYNMVRHAGTVYSMLDLWETTKDPELLTAAENALEYLLKFVEPFGEDDAHVLAYGDKIKLGGVALTALALAEHGAVTGERTHLQTAQRLCRYITQSQHPSGEFVHQRHHPAGTVRKFVSEYYPGEALLALVRVYALDRDETWLDVAEKGARFLIEVRDRGIATRQLTHDHWLLYALNRLYRVRPERLYLDHALRIAQAILMGQRRTPAIPDYAGSYYTPPRSTPTATRTEGLLAAYELARDFASGAEATAIFEGARHGIGFQLQTQITPERALYLKDPRRALGGFTRSLTNFEVRIDYVQHNISAILLLSRQQHVPPKRSSRRLSR